MFIETLVLENFQCFGPKRTIVTLGPDLTAFVGANGSGKTVACQALLRLFGVSNQDRKPLTGGGAGMIVYVRSSTTT